MARKNQKAITKASDEAYNCRGQALGGRLDYDHKIYADFEATDA
jgi:hypothetical protein